MEVGENKNVEMCYLDDEAVYEFIVSTWSSTGRTEVYVIGDVELNGIARCLNRFNSK